MKRHFLTGLKALAVSALAFAAVSCYDDSELWGELEGLEQRVAALEQKLNTEVATLNSKLGAVEAAYKKADEAFNIADENVSAALKALTAELDALDGTVDGYVTSNDAALKKAIEDLMKADKENADAYKALADMDADLLAALSKLGVVSVEKKDDGSVVLTFADKSTVTVGAPVKNADNTGLVTIVDGEWAVIDEDGVVKKLGVPVDPETELFFRVKNNVLEISYDGKKTWVSTEVEVNDETSLNIVTGVEYTEGDEYVTIVVGDAEYVLPFYQADNSDLTLGRTEAFFMYGATKTIDLKAEGVKEYYVMSKPDGWKASLEENVLTVTAPAKELIELGAGELEGEVLVHATADNGTCKVASFKVTTGEAFTLSYNDGNVEVFTAYAAEQTNMMTGMTYYNFIPLYFGITPLADFLGNGTLADYLRTQIDPDFGSLYNEFGSITGFANNYGYLESDSYVEGEQEEISVNIPLADIITKTSSWVDLTFEYDEDDAYVLWLVPQGDESGYDFDSAIYVTTGSYVSFVADESSYDNVEFAATFFGADGYAVGAVAKSKFDQWGIDEEYTYEDALKEYMIEPGQPWYGMPAGPFAGFVGGDMTSMGELYPSGTATINLADIVLQEQSMGMYPGMPSGPSVDPDSEYFVWVLPYYKNKAFADYKYEDILFYTCETEPLTKDETVKASVVVTASYNALTYTITPPTGGSTKFAVMPEEEYQDYLNEDDSFNEEKFIESMKLNMWSLDEEYEDIQDFNIEPGSKYYILTYTTCDGKYAIGIEDVTTPTVAEWVESLEAGATWTLTGDVTLSSSIFVDKNLTIDLNGNTLTTTKELAEGVSSAVICVSAGDVTIKNGTIATSGTLAHKKMGAVWVYGNQEANVTIENATLKGNNWNETVEGQTDCQATVYVNNPNGYVTINSGEFYCVKQEQVAGQNQILNYKNEFTTQNIVVKGGTFYGMDPAKGNGAEVSYVAEGYESTETAEDVYTVAMRTPAGKQWVSADNTFAISMLYMPTQTLFDLGTFKPDASLPDNIFTFSVDFAPINSLADPTWVFANYYGTYTVTPEDDTSGVLSIDMMMAGQNLTIPYSEFDGDSVIFDFSAFNLGELEFTRPAEAISILMAPPTSGGDE